ncbi:ABC transporter permease [Natrononativus amylolyticus]|uniref:ABC transporter permease n=1 Tax=Natrononativus amylolyticus TaxID=2963434 RepID=UPI0020CB81D9|nr:ABC transporter permease [Natrononativus amylolyticus]
MSTPTDTEVESVSRRRLRWQRRLNALRNWVGVMKDDRLGQVGLAILAAFILVGIFARPITIEIGPAWFQIQPFSLAPYEPGARVADENLQGPTWDHPLGTTALGRDVLSQVIVGTRVTLIVGTIAAFMAVFIGANVGIISAYYGGWVDDVLMRITDVVYGVPFLPFAIALVFILGASLVNVIFAIVLILWRGTARVVRSQVLSHKQRPYVESAKAIGASNFRIMYVQIMPNVLPLISLYAAFAVAWAVIAEASLSFLGLGPPGMLSWGEIIYDVRSAGALREAWWWVFPPGICIMLFVMSVFFIGRSLEKVVNPELRHTQ